MVKLLSGIVPLFLFSAAQAQTSAPEPPIESNPIGITIFLVLFVGFCIVVAWLMWRQRKTKKGKEKE